MHRPHPPIVSRDDWLAQRKELIDTEKGADKEFGNRSFAEEDSIDMALLPVPGLDNSIRGKFIRLSPQRRFICDLMHIARRVPTVPTQRRMHLEDMVAARRASGRRISWCAIFMKAYAIVCQSRPELRRCYLPWLWPHLYEHPINVASFMLEREYRGEDGVFSAQVREPEKMSLVDLDQLVRWHKSAPFEEVPSFTRAMRLSRLPRLLRRFIWWMGLLTDGACRAHFLAPSRSASWRNWALQRCTRYPRFQPRSITACSNPTAASTSA
jgi:hypothetical protein